MRQLTRVRVLSLLVVFSCGLAATAQPPQSGASPERGGPPDGPRPGDGPGGMGPGGPAARELKIRDKFDADKDGKLNDTERAQARVFAKESSRQRGRGGRGGRGGGPGGGPGGPGPGGGPPGSEPAADATPREPSKITPADVTSYPEASLYDQGVIRTFFLTFKQADWFEECADFYRTDVEVPATLMVDGKTYADVGVGFRGNSSYFGVQGKKKSFALSLDLVHKDQRLHGYKTLNLLNAHSDPSFLREAIHSFIARRFTQALKSNLVRVVVNGENWGVYANSQQFDRDFLDDEFGTKKGVRWKAPANFRAQGLAYLGAERAAYEGSYQLKTDLENEEPAWQRLITLCKVLNETPIEQLEHELPKVLDVDAALRFVALDAVVLDGDGYASRGSDFVLWEGPDGRFRPLPYDSNEILGAGMGMRGGRRGRDGQPPPAGDATVPARPPGDAEPGRPPQGGDSGTGAQSGPPQPAPAQPVRSEQAPPGPPPQPGTQDGPARPDRPREPGRGPGGPGGMGGASPTSSPLALQESKRPLSRLLEVPAWKARYLAYVRAMVTEGLDWNVLGPFVAGLHGKLDPLVRDDDKALYGHAAFTRSVEALQRTVETRTKTILEHPSLQGVWPTVAHVECQLIEREGLVCVQVQARVTGSAQVTLWATDSRAVPYAPVTMLDDGAHHDGAKGDGVFGAVTPAFAKKGNAYVFVAANTGAGDAARVALSPSGGSGRPWVVDLKPR